MIEHVYRRDPRGRDYGLQCLDLDEALKIVAAEKQDFLLRLVAVLHENNLLRDADVMELLGRGWALEPYDLHYSDADD
ncbi:hypothetical protein phiCbK_077 [Caulobacter phage phiCbK]|uniref:Uncharacterized protein n=5 Tax=Viruses TaxID=10239 RepID=J3SVQ1_9CAUD|nr:hypothetical protein D865_gp174 [Caulobacter phage phiCbK]ARB14465.1 hypothetical protein Ccr5_gp245 [Caulobacter phage Ccr5]ARB15157.1 hypothetical protein Ccr32_gp239 [Caulobacter phage Ccr32]ARB15491.1 hypothetical protein Ccr34_gp249 [Caulobacter phage Ccr34]AFO71591.1 hypothetical protein phiCbK_077 [Caulobacter phage phiCbK]AFU87076.1 hypothetical protein CbK_gp244 [Caulobacter phage phiCbK]